jgi:hypothetical protein
MALLVLRVENSSLSSIPSMPIQLQLYSLPRILGASVPTHGAIPIGIPQGLGLVQDFYFKLSGVIAAVGALFASSMVRGSLSLSLSLFLFLSLFEIENS